MINADPQPTGDKAPRCVLEQSPDGIWSATVHDDLGEQRHEVGGWDSLGDLTEEHEVLWRTPADLQRFRAQFGEPPAAFDTTHIGFDDGS